MNTYTAWPVSSKPWTLGEIALAFVLVVALAALGLLFGRVPPDDGDCGG